MLTSKSLLPSIHSWRTQKPSGNHCIDQTSNSSGWFFIVLTKFGSVTHLIIIPSYQIRNCFIHKSAWRCHKLAFNAFNLYNTPKISAGLEKLSLTYLHSLRFFRLYLIIITSAQTALSKKLICNLRIECKSYNYQVFLDVVLRLFTRLPGKSLIFYTRTLVFTTNKLIYKIKQPLSKLSNDTVAHVLCYISLFLGWRYL